MKELDDLSTYEKKTLVCFKWACNNSYHKHVRPEAIKKHFHGRNWKYVKKAIRGLVASGFLIEHPTRGGKTYNISKPGLDAANRIEEE